MRGFNFYGTVLIELSSAHPKMTRNMKFFGAFALLFMIVPFLPGGLLALADNIVVRAVLILLVLIYAMESPMLGIMALLVVGLIFIQRNKYKIAKGYTSHDEKLFKIDTVSPALEVLETPPTAPIQPTYDTPAMEVHPFAPGIDSGSDEFKAVAETIDHKVILPTASVRGVAQVEDQLFAHEYKMHGDGMAHDDAEKGYGSA